MNDCTVLILPGWLGSGPGHWQSLWQEKYGYERVQQHDWQRPLRGDWTARLQDAVLAAPAHRPLLLAAHSLGCILTAWWATHSPQAQRVAGALLVAPPDIERADNLQKIPGWAPPARQRLPFASILVASSDDPFCSLTCARQLAADWGAQLHEAGARGHINAESALGHWPEGHALLMQLTRRATAA
ncbi:MAG: RBBP9/YdeN family alpha/beta hydrolase [Ottowia sp.]